MKKILNLIVFVCFVQFASYAQTRYIKIVVHVLYTNATNNISDATIQDYISQVNKGFAKQLIPTFPRATSIFDTLWTDTEIQLCMASLDPAGTPTTGITHTLIADKYSPAQNPISPVWNPTSYFNIYIAPVYYEPGFPNFVLGGWASTPTSPQMGATFNYVVVASNSIPYIPELLTHEIGHVFGLEHLSTDVINDTPAAMENIDPSTGYTTTCSANLQSLNTTSLAQDGTHWGGIDPPDMVENFMGLSFCCSYMFTTGQKNAMHTYIEAHLSNWISTSCFTTTENLPDKLNTIRVFPNPATQSFTITSKMHNLRTIQIIDLLGKEIMAIPFLQTKQIIIESEKMQTGIYFLQITDENNQLVNMKIRIE